MDWRSRKVNLMLLPEHVKRQLLARFTDKHVPDLTEAERTHIFRNYIEGMSAQEVLNTWLEYEGIIGYTDKLINLFESVQQSAQ